MGQTSDTRARLVSAAADMFHTHGYRAVGVEQICQTAGVKKGSFYHFFSSKRDLALAAIDAQWENTRDTLLEPVFASDLPPAGRIRLLFTMTRDRQVSGMDDNGQIKGCPIGNLALELSTQDVTIRRKCEEIFRRMASYFEMALEQDSPGSDNHAEAQALLAYYQGVILLAKTSNNPELIDTLAAGFQFCPNP